MAFDQTIRNKEVNTTPLFWRPRVEDMKCILDQLDVIEASIPEIKGRLDRSRIAVAGHSMGGHTAGMLLGAQLTDEDGTKVNLAEPRIKAGVLLTPLGNGGADLSAFATGISFFRHPSFAEMTTPALVAVGDVDVSSHLTVRGADWHADPYRLSTGPKCCSRSLAEGICSAEFLDTMQRRRQTRAPNEWRRSNG